MCCEEIERQLGRYIDNELSAAERDEVEAHLESCSSCLTELAELRELVAGMANAKSMPVPDSLWPSIERRLNKTEGAAPPSPPVVRFRLRTAPWAIAAGLVLAVGLGMFGLSSLDTTAKASTVDFGVLLDALPLDAQKAFRKFLVRYDAKPTTPVAAKRIASHLNFDTPAVLPGGFRLQSVYELRIGGTKGIAAAYDRDGEFLAAVFHPPMKHEKFGSHESYPCVIGEHCGHKVQVGEWKLVHLTDPTTCHCLLSRLDEQSEIPMVMKAIAPELAETGATDVHHHP
jgi:hypothetical protein